LLLRPWTAIVPGSVYADVTNEEMITSIRQAVGGKGELPLTLIVLDEAQQYIGEDGQRAEQQRDEG